MTIRPLTLTLTVVAALTTALALDPAQPRAQSLDSSYGAEYDAQLFRLSEVLGAMHHLRNVCRAGEGQLWRDQMIKLLDAEAPSPARRASLVRRFNKGYRTYQENYPRCTDEALTESQRFAKEGAQLSQSIALARAAY